VKTRWMTAMAVALLAVTSGVAAAQGNGHGQNRGQAKKAEHAARAQRRAEARFNDHDRQLAHDWYEHHRSSPPRGFRVRDRLSPEYEVRIRSGYVFEPYVRRRAYPAPVELTAQFGPAPRGYRYMVIGGHIVLVDAGYRVADVFRLTINIGS
jgi:hypothetical protein